MKNQKTIFGWNNNIEESMMVVREEDKDTAKKLVRFFGEKQERYTYDLNQEKYMINSFFPAFPGESWNRFVHGLNRISLEQRTPLQADLVVTGKCHCDCWHCFRANYTDQSELSIKTLRQIYTSLHNMGTAVVGITGGEPMLRKDILDVISMIPDDMEGQLYTTGIRIDEEFAEKISATNLKRCIISLDHYKEEVVCNLRHYSSAFKNVMNAIDALRKTDIYIAVTVCMTEELLLDCEFEKYIEFAKSLGVNEIRVVSTIPEGKLEGKNVVQLHLKSGKLIDQIKKKYRSSLEYPVIVNFGEIESFEYIGCGAGTDYISVNSDGKVTPCVAVPLSFGNIYEDSLESIYDKMAAYFPICSCSCMGIACDAVRKKKGIIIDQPPLDTETSVEIVSQCKCSMKSTKLFRAIR